VLPIPPALLDLLTLSDLSERWAYVTLGVSAIFTEELAPLVGGFAADQGHVRLAGVVLACATGVFALSAVLYFVGRWRAAWVRLKLRKSPPIVKKLLRAMRWSPWRSTLLARVAFGGRIALPLACGAAHVPPWIFLTGSAIASLVWAAAVAGLGWVFGEGAVLVLGEVRKYEGWMVLVLAALGAGGYWWLRDRQRKRGDLPEVLAPREPRDESSATDPPRDTTSN
jgi:membrane protein DedA with SNARE-associated domain